MFFGLLFVLFFDAAHLVVLRCDRPNEYYDCGSACHTNCIDPLATCPIINKKCNDDCYCLPGYGRLDSNNDTSPCVPLSQCPSQCGKCFGESEEYVQNGSPCDSLCSRLGTPCPAHYSFEGCVCKQGFARSFSGECIPIEQCPSGRCDNINEVYKCGKCHPSCGSVGPCQGDSIFCTDGCYCRTGYVRASNGNCIPEWTCY